MIFRIRDATYNLFHPHFRILSDSSVYFKSWDLSSIHVNWVALHRQWFFCTCVYHRGWLSFGAPRTLRVWASYCQRCNVMSFLIHQPRGHSIGFLRSSHQGIHSHPPEHPWRASIIYDVVGQLQTTSGGRFESIEAMLFGIVESSAKILFSIFPCFVWCLETLKMAKISVQINREIGWTSLNYPLGKRND